uniref:Corticotropin-releasing factor receptor 2 n=1 Tax=Chrysolophus pictus TaxID=9089 RepID=A0A8C3PYA8_CHRPC
MDVTISQFILEEFDVNCSLLDLQETVLESFSISFLGFHGLYCNATTDQIGTCWPRASAGKLVERPCPEFFNGIKYNTTRNAYRECLGNGTWASKINYSQCEPILDDKRKYAHHYKIALIINYLGHCISVGALIVAFMLFLCLRSIRCLRNIIHWNLITTFILRNVMWFLLQMIDHNIHESNEVSAWRCTTIKIKPKILNFFVLSMHSCIIVQLDTPLRRWSNERWWDMKPGKYIDYIYQGPVILVLLINFVFLFNIVRILMTKLRASTTSETIQYRKAVKATLVLLPLLGITYMLFFVNPGEDDISQIVFIYFNSFLQSFQGFFVSVFYCFLNGEVRSAARKRWHRWQDHHSLRVRVARAMSIPTSPTRISFHSIKQTAAV